MKMGRMYKRLDSITPRNEGNVGLPKSFLEHGEDVELRKTEQRASLIEQPRARGGITRLVGMDEKLLAIPSVL
jgi:hypothetical protein